MRSAREELSAGSGGWLYRNLSSRGWTHMCRGYVPPVQSGQASAIVDSAGKNNGPLCEDVCSQRGLFFAPALVLAHDGSTRWLLIARVYWQYIEATQNTALLPSLCDPSAEQSIAMIQLDGDGSHARHFFPTRVFNDFQSDRRYL
jgi:hypothetical protein